MEFKDKVNQAAGALKSMLYTYFNKVIGEISLFKLQSFELLSRILLEFPKIECSDIMIGEANIWLLRNEAGIYI
jgi:hypothetical protein